MVKKVKGRYSAPRLMYEAYLPYSDKIIAENDKQYRKEHNGKSFFEDLALQYPEEARQWLN